MEANMKINMGNTDRTLRLILGLAVLGFGYVFESYWGLLGLIPAFTALLFALTTLFNFAALE